ncbi:hypothetical protein LVJ94_13135 [Pendulispora rubella]|uniref:Secreted protein n=1 Tax=Pendulispora rubella TaxID=2741070 RepID=A0ABZ2LF34_9BACT
MRRLLFLAAWPLVALASFADTACNRKPELSFTLHVPDGVRDQATWYEVGVFADAACPSGAQLSAGIPTTGTRARVAFRSGTKTPPAIGDLPRGTYAFAAVAKKDDCTVLATGCSSLDVGDANEVSITLKAKETPSGACGEGTVCTNAQCTPSTDNDQPSVGAGCSLELVGAGPLGNPLGSAGTIMSYPAIVPTEKGFLVAYREYDAIQGRSRLTFAPIDSGGGLGTLVTQDLPDRCNTAEEADAVGLAYEKDRGLAVVARALCNDKAGFDLLAVDAAGTITKQGAETGAFVASARLSLSSAHAVAKAPSGKDFFVAGLKDGQALLSTTNDVQFAQSTPVSVGGAAPHSDAWVATSNAATAVLSAAQSAGAADAGADAGKESVLRLQMVAGASVGNLPQPLEIPGTWGSMALQGTRLVVASNGNTAGRSVVFHVFDLGKNVPTVEDGFNTEALGKVSFADVAYNKAHAFFAVEQPGAITIVAYDQMATDTPTFLREEQLALNPRVPALAQVRDGRLAIAATDTRVAVVWATARTLTEHDPTGGYAVLACR